MSRPLWITGVLKFGFPQTWIIAKMTRWPLVGKLLDNWIFEGTSMIMVPRVIPVNLSVPAPSQTVLPLQVVEHFINQANYHWVMNECLCRAGMKCRDFPIDLGCLFLGEAALQINPKMGRQVKKEDALEYAKRCREAGLVHLIGRAKLDEVWLKVTPGFKLLTICNCCPCCCVYNNLPDMTRDISDRFTKMPGVNVTVNDLCSGCGLCAEDVCWVDAIKMVDGRAVISDMCKGCGRCLAVCKDNAIQLTISSGQFVKNSIDKIAPLVDIR